MCRYQSLRFKENNILNFFVVYKNNSTAALIFHTAFIFSLMIVVWMSNDETVWNACGLLMMLANTYFTWKVTDKGLHPSFLFQLFLIFFQGGRLISYFMSGDFTTVWVIDLYSTPITLSVETIKTVVLLLGVCSYLIYFTAAFSIPAIRFNLPEIKTGLFFKIFVATLPFYIYKNVAYLIYVFTHGGYIAIYANNGEHLQSVGFAIRLLANVCFSAYLLYILQEYDYKRMMYVMIFFVSLSSLELLIGLRGKYFVFLLMNILLFKQRIKQGFNIAYLGFIAGIVVFASIFIAFFRENIEVETGSLLQKFFYTQGNSSIVSALAVEKYNLFHPFSLYYIINAVFLAFLHQNDFGTGGILANDLSNYLSPEAFDLGFGTGSSFIAELYLLYGISTVIFGTFLIGVIMSALKSYTSGITGTISFILLIGCVYLPRTSYLDPVGQFIKFGLPCLFVYGICIALTLLFTKKLKFSN